ncbi:MAG: FAD-dependent oxidoreductase [Candidatus Nanopelagicales bacterium]
MSPLPCEQQYQVAVVGAGIAGAATAWQLARCGRTVLLLDADDPLAVSTTVHATAKVTVGQGTLPARIAAARGEAVALAYLRMQSHGMALLRDLAREIGDAARLQELPQVVYAREPGSAADQLRTGAELARRAGIEVTSDETTLPERAASAFRYPALALHPGEVLKALLSRAAAAGVHSAFGNRVTGISGTGPVEVRTANGTMHRAERVVFATHSPILLRGGHFAHLQARRHCAITAVVADHPSEVMTYDVTGPGYSTRPLGAGGDPGEIFVVGAAHDTGTQLRLQHWQHLAEWAASKYGCARVSRKWAAQDYATTDGAPLIGAISPWDRRLFVVTGCNAWGLATAMYAAEALTRAVTGQPAESDGLWSPNRFGGPRGVLTMAKWQATVGTRLVAGLARGSRGDREPADLARGEAAVLRCGAKQIAAYRDEAGTLHQVSARCTHLGCTVDWNAQERSWDCPCHGSRFNIDGAVLESPASRPLPKL